MGYTHYWYMPEGKLEKRLWEHYSRMVEEIVGPDVGDGQEIDKLTIDESVILFEGLPAHETFWFGRELKQRSWREGQPLVFNFCKTARKPYDRHVTACLIGLKLVFKDGVRIRSDGDPDEWTAGYELFKERLNHQHWGNPVSAKAAMKATMVDIESEGEGLRPCPELVSIEATTEHDDFDNTEVEWKEDRVIGP